MKKAHREMKFYARYERRCLVYPGVYSVYQQGYVVI